MDIAAAVIKARKDRDWRQVDLASAARVAPWTITSIELGRSVQERNLRRVLKALDLELRVAPRSPTPAPRRVRAA